LHDLSLSLKVPEGRDHVCPIFLTDFFGAWTQGILGTMVTNSVLTLSGNWYTFSIALASWKNDLEGLNNTVHINYKVDT
jgi:hypothetical protein